MTYKLLPLVTCASLLSFTLSASMLRLEICPTLTIGPHNLVSSRADEMGLHHARSYRPYPNLLVLSGIARKSREKGFQQRSYNQYLVRVPTAR